MSEMVERVVDRMLADEGIGLSTPMRPHYRSLAISAIIAMSDPTPEMLKACWPLHHPWGKNAPPPEDRQVAFDAMKDAVAADWNTMIDAALK